MVAEFIPKLTNMIPRRLLSTKAHHLRRHSPESIAALLNKPNSSKLIPSLLSYFQTSSSHLLLQQTLPLLKNPLPLFASLLPLPDILTPSITSLTFHLLLRRPHNLSLSLDLLFALSSSHPHLLSDLPFNLLIRSLSSSHRPRDLLHLFHLMPSLNVSPSVFTYNSVLDSLVRHGRTNSALNLLDEMLSRPGTVKPDVWSFNAVIRGFCMSKMVDQGFQIFKRMEEHGCSPDVVTYNTLVDGLCRVGKVKVARNLVGGMKRKGMGPNVVTYTTLVRGYCVCGEAVKGLEVIDEMTESGIVPNKITYNTIVKGLCEAKRMDLVKEVLEKGGGLFKPDTCTFNTLMHAHCSVGNVSEAMKVFQRMVELKVKTDSASYSMIIRALCQNKEYDRAEKLVDELLERGVLKRRGVCVPLVASYNLMFEYLCLNGKADKAGMLLGELIERRATLDFSAFKTVVLGYCRESRFEEGYKFVVSMVRKTLKPDFEMLNVLMNGFLSKEDAVFAKKVLDRMLNSGHRPGTSTFHSVLSLLLKENSRAEEASNLLELMLVRKIRQNIDLSTDIVVKLLEMGLNDRAFEIIKMIYDNEYSVKLEKMVEFLFKESKHLEANEILLFSLKKNEILDESLYVKAITGLCRIDKALEGFKLFFEMTENGTRCASIACLNSLLNGLTKDGRSREADFVRKQIRKIESDATPISNASSRSKLIRSNVRVR